MNPQRYNTEVTDEPLESEKLKSPQPENAPRTQNTKAGMSGFLTSKDSSSDSLEQTKDQDERKYSREYSQEYRTPYDRSADPNESAMNHAKNSAETDVDPNAELLEELKNRRDDLRGNGRNTDPQQSKKRLIKFFLTAILLAVVVCIAFILIKPSTKINSPEQRETFVLPSDIDDRSVEDRSAITIIRLAREDKSDELTKNWLGVKDVSSTSQEFKDLISSYANSADGKNVELIEKKVGKKNLSPVGTTELNAVSFVFKSKYFEHTNSLYTKVNLYEQTDKPGTWKLYLFEFNAEQNDQPPAAEL